jgi:hypothetical protein
MLKLLAEGFPSEPVREPNFTGRRKRLGRIQRRGRYINRVGTRVVLIGQWRSAGAAKCSDHGRRRTEPHRGARRENEIFAPHYDPSDGRGASGEPARSAMTACLGERHAGDSIANRCAKTPALGISIRHDGSNLERLPLVRERATPNKRSLWQKATNARKSLYDIALLDRTIANTEPGQAGLPKIGIAVCPFRFGRPWRRAAACAP